MAARSRTSVLRHCRPSWKLLGLAGVAGVAATGAVIARKSRNAGDLPPDELRARLHERLRAVSAGDGADAPAPADSG